MYDPRAGQGKACGLDARKATVQRHPTADNDTVILSAAKDLLASRSAEHKQILRYAQDDSAGGGRRFLAIRPCQQKSPPPCEDGLWIDGAPYEIRTRVLALRGPRPRPLDEGSRVVGTGRVRGRRRKGPARDRDGLPQAPVHKLGSIWGAPAAGNANQPTFQLPCGAAATDAYPRPDTSKPGHSWTALSRSGHS